MARSSSPAFFGSVIYAKFRRSGFLNLLGLIPRCLLRGRLLRQRGLPPSVSFKSFCPSGTLAARIFASDRNSFAIWTLSDGVKC